MATPTGNQVIDRTALAGSNKPLFRLLIMKVSQASRQTTRGRIEKHGASVETAQFALSSAEPGCFGHLIRHNSSLWIWDCITYGKAGLQAIVTHSDCPSPAEARSNLRAPNGRASGVEGINRK